MKTVETGNKNHCMTKAMNVLQKKLRFRAFLERVCPQILLLESIDYFGTSEHFGGRKKKRKKNLNFSKRLTGRVL